ncbi:MAG: hypothetical protein H8F28_18375 [Fibrella sp.]|nr:hypothetical protein [Armatimonadota bacterium]
MAKISRPIVYVVVAAVAIYAIVLVTEPEKPVTKPKKRTSLGAGAKAPAGFLTEDLTATFTRYQGKSRDAFKPGIMPKQTVMNTLPGGRDSDGVLSGPGLRGSWTLTGINILDGDRSALIENATTGDSAFLKSGDSWNGLQVVAIESDTVVFLNTLGQRTQLKFVDPNDETPTTPGTTTITPGTTPGRTVITVTPINKNGLTVAPGGVAPVIPALPSATTGGLGANLPPTRGRQ